MADVRVIYIAITIIIDVRISSVEIVEALLQATLGRVRSWAFDLMVEVLLSGIF